MIVECAICVGFAIFSEGDKFTDEKFITPKLLCVIISVVIAYFVQQRLVPNALYATNFIWDDHVWRLVMNAAGAAVVTIFIYYCRRSKDNYSQLLVILIAVHIIYIYGKSFDQLTISAFCYYVIFYLLGSNVAFMLLKLSEPK